MYDGADNDAGPEFHSRALRALQHAIGSDLMSALSSIEGRDTANGAARVTARIHANINVASQIDAARLEQWRRLAADPGSPKLRQGTVQQQFSAAGRTIAASLRQIADDPERLQALSHRTSSTAAWFGEVIESTKAYIDDYEAAVPRVAESVVTTRSDPVGLAKRLGDYLHARYPTLPARPILSLYIVPGGGSKETAVFKLVDNTLLPRHLVLRRDLGNTPTGTAVFGEFELLRNLHAARLPVPEPILAERDPRHLDGAFIVVREVTDAVRVGHMFSELNDMRRLHPSFAPELAHALARLHRLDGRSLGENLGGHHEASDPMQMVLNFRTLWRGLKHRPPMEVPTELGFAWLLSHPLPEKRPIKLVHGDVGMHNMMMRDGKLEAILDWELTHVGDPAEDIGYVRTPLVLPLTSWNDFLAAYLEAGGDEAACDREAVNWYAVWAHTRNSVYTSIYYDLAAQGKRSDIRAFVSGMDHLPRTQDYLMRELVHANQ